MKKKSLLLGLATLALLGADDCDRERVGVYLKAYPLPDGGYACPMEECPGGVCCYEEIEVKTLRELQDQQN